MDLMSEGQWKRWDVIGRLRAGKLTLAQGALVLALSVRVRRGRGRGAEEGRPALRHGNTGRAPAPPLAPRGLEGRGPWLCLVGAIDDATGELLPGAHFVEQECAAAYLRVLHAIATTCGLPGSIYMDQHGALKRNDDHWTLAEELRGRQDPTQVGGALEALAIACIYALSPQAKGRVERLWGTLQDRLTSELRLAQARTVAEANAALARYRLDHNRRFAVRPHDATAAWRPVRSGLDLDRICRFRYEATVLNDNTVRLGGTIVLDIPPRPRGRSWAGTRVEVRQLLDGTWRVYSGDRLVTTGAVTTHGELRALLHRRKRGRGAPTPPPVHASFAEARP